MIYIFGEAVGALHKKHYAASQSHASADANITVVSFEYNIGTTTGTVKRVDEDHEAVEIRRKRTVARSGIITSSRHKTIVECIKHLNEKKPTMKKYREKISQKDENATQRKNIIEESKPGNCGGAGI